MNEVIAPPMDRRKGSLEWKTLAMLGIAFAAAGCFSPWSFGVDQAGWAGMLLAFSIVATFYLCLLLCLSELASAIPSAGAGQAFASKAFGPTAGFFAGAASLIQYVCGTSALGFLLASYVQALTGLDLKLAVILIYVVVVAIHSRGVAESATLTVVLSLLATFGVALFVVTAASSVSVQQSLQIVRDTQLHVATIWAAIPFAVGLLLGIEGVPFAAEEASNPGRDIPKALFVALSVTVSLALLVIGVGPLASGIDAIRGSDAPMLSALSSPLVGAAHWKILAVNLAALCAVGVAFFSSVFGYSRQIAAMAQDGELPALLGRMSRRQVPCYALILPSTFGMLIALSGKLDQLIVLMVFAGAISYLMIFASFCRMRSSYPNLARPYRVRAGAAIAGTGIVLGFFIFSACIAADLRWSIYGATMLATLLVYRIAASYRKSKNAILN